MFIYRIFFCSFPLESLPPDFDMAKIGSSGQPSSDFHPDSLPMEFPSPAKNNSMTLSVTSREEVYSISEVELFASTWPPKESSGNVLISRDKKIIIFILNILISRVFFYNSWNRPK